MSSFIKLDQQEQGRGEMHLALLMQSALREKSVEVTAWWKPAQS